MADYGCYVCDKKCLILLEVVSKENKISDRLKTVFKMLKDCKKYINSLNNEKVTTMESSVGTDVLKEEYIKKLHTFKDHTFQVKDDAKMEELKNSIRENGILTPLICFYNEENQLEIISGHRRKRACELLGVEKVPIIIKKFTREQAVIAMGESNLQTREEILPSEKAFSYEAMLAAMKKQGKRTDLTSVPGEQKLKRGRSDDELSKKVNESRAQIHRYIRLTNLIEPLLNLVDKKRIGLRPAVELSYMPLNFQKYVYEIYEQYDITPSHAQTIEMRRLLKEGLLNENVLNDILMEEKPNQRERLCLSGEFIERYLPQCKTEREIMNRIAKALMLYSIENPNN